MTPSAPHLTEVEYLAALAGGLAELDPAAREHVSKCSPCATRLEVAFERAHGLTASGVDWAARVSAFSEAMRHRLRVALALQAAAQHPGTGSRARRWLEHFSAAAEAAARVAIDGIGQISRAAGEGIAALVRPEARGRFALVAMPGGIRTRGGPVPTLGPGVAPGPATGQITVQADGRRIEVRLRGWPTQGVAPLVLLVPTVGDAAPQITPGERSREEGQVVAVFTDVEPGNYLVLVEPSESTSP